jgi:hypothetical protein
MWYAKFGSWLCLHVASACFLDATPSVSTIQAVYEREASAGSSLHDLQLRVLDSKCHPGSGQAFLCEVTFTSVSDPNERLYFDIVAVARSGDGWELKSGLCKR